ncbi:N-acetylmuramoyl-L-alanine amidase family protein [Deinococcus sp.]|uniref:N-acetylmuramoyl-L-alanine amidase family protein n=1 Tax=Deinococcus sp. TaxID=47478 RepID=UPI003CC6435E
MIAASASLIPPAAGALGLPTPPPVAPPPIAQPPIAQPPVTSVPLSAPQLPAVPPALAAAPIFVAYPTSGVTVAYDHVIFEGSVLPGADLSINGRAIPVGPDGLFTEWLPLQAGLNELLLTSRLNAETKTLSFRVTSAPAVQLPATPARILPASAQPSGVWSRFDLGALAPQDRRLPLGFSGSPGGRALAWVGGSGPFSLNESGRGQYSGGYTLHGSELLSRAAVRYLLILPDGSRASAVAGGSVSTLLSPRRAEVSAPDLGRGVNPYVAGWSPAGGANLLYPRQGTRFTVLGEQNGFYLTRLPGLPLLDVSKRTATLLPEGTPALRAALGGISTEATPTHLTLCLPLTARVPFQLVQSADTLELRLYDTGGDPAALNLIALSDPLLASLNWRWAGGVLSAVLTLKTSQQWGYDAVYDGTTLRLSLRRPPPAPADPARPLAGRIIVIDPGHGGTELGGAGALRIQEKDLVLSTAVLVAAGLRELGASVVLTRQSDVQVPLYNRPLLAETLDADLILSIHANALPDGSDPRGRRGSGAYWTQPQARPLAACLVSALAAGLPELGVDTPEGAGLHLADLALTRPSTQLSVLVEAAYLTDAGNLRALMSDEGRARIASALVRGVSDFYAGACAGR